MSSVCVVGAGIIGLSTAVEVQRRLPNVKISLVADQFTPHLTSDVAAGIWRTTGLISDRDCERKLAWADETMTLLRRLAKEDAQRFGASIVSGYELADYEKPGWESNLRRSVLDYAVLSPRRIRGVCDDGRMTHGIHYTTTFLEPSTYLPVLMNEFEVNGGKVKQARVEELRGLTSNYDVVVNCSGLGSYTNHDDKTMYPIRGQVFRVKAPFIKMHYDFTVGSHRHYALPNQNCVVLGGIHDKDEWSTEWDETTGNWIWSSITSFLPSVKFAPIINRYVGLRPGRPTVRLEMERCPNGRNIVHNYGHGAYGVTLHYGCALEAARLVGECVHKAKL